METRSAKRKKLSREEEHDHDDEQEEDDESGGVDQISDLPDAILHRILSLLPIKTVAKTSILSQRWKWIWYTLPDLDFLTLDYPILNIPTKVMNSSKRKRVLSPASAKGADFIGQVLAHRDPKSSNLRSLRFCAHLSFTRLNALVRCAVRHSVQELDIEVSTNDYFNFPRSVLSCESLRVFKLKSQYPGFRLPPTSIMRSGFQSLHTLSFSLVMLYEQSSLVDLFDESSFPLLRKLNMDECNGLRSLRVGCRGLQDLTLDNCFQLNDLEVVCGKLEKMRVTNCFDTYSNESWVKIVAPKLKTFVWEYNAVTEICSLENLDSLVEASAGLFVIDEQFKLNEAQHRSVSNFLCGLSHAQSFTLENQSVEIFSCNNFANMIRGPFNHIKTLELRTGFAKRNIPVLACLFRSCPNLRTLIVRIIHDFKITRKYWNRELWDLSSSGEERYWESQAHELKPFLNHLYEVRIHGFSECENDICFAKFLLKHGKVLQEMTLSSGHNNSRDSLRRERIKSQMMGFSRASSKAKIVFQ